MKITDIKTWNVFAQFNNWTFVKVYTDEGIYGVGEATLRSRQLAVCALIEELKRQLIGMNPFEIETIWQTLYNDIHYRRAHARGVRREGGPDRRARLHRAQVGPLRQRPLGPRP